MKQISCPLPRKKGKQQFSYSKKPNEMWRKMKANEPVGEALKSNTQMSKYRHIRGKECKTPARLYLNKACSCTHRSFWLQAKWSQGKGNATRLNLECLVSWSKLGMGWGENADCISKDL